MHHALEKCLISIALLVSPPSFAADTIKLGLIQPLSVACANMGEDGVHDFQFLIEVIYAKGGEGRIAAEP